MEIHLRGHLIGEPDHHLAARDQAINLRLDLYRNQFFNLPSKLVDIIELVVSEETRAMQDPRIDPLSMVILRSRLRTRILYAEDIPSIAHLVTGMEPTDARDELLDQVFVQRSATQRALRSALRRVAQALQAMRDWKISLVTRPRLRRPQVAIRPF